MKPAAALFKKPAAALSMKPAAALSPRVPFQGVPCAMSLQASADAIQQIVLVVEPPV